MGLIKAALAGIGTQFADQWLEFLAVTLLIRKFSLLKV